MRVLNDFVCPEGHQKEYFLDNRTLTTCCDTCGAEAKKVQAAIRFKLEGTSGAFPTAYDQWAKKRNQKLKQELKQEASTGEPVTFT